MEPTDQPFIDPDLHSGKVQYNTMVPANEKNKQ